MVVHFNPPKQEQGVKYFVDNYLASSSKTKGTGGLMPNSGALP